MRISKTYIAIFIVWLFHISGLAGMLLGYESWFLDKTALNLLVSFGLLCWVWQVKHWQDLAIVFCWFIMGMFVEWVGVQYGWLFGEYRYGENLGPKFRGVPYMIGINWAMLVMITGSLVKHMNNQWLRAALGALMMVALDFLIEPLSAPLDFWHWRGGDIPLRNYLAWFVIAFLMHLLFQKLKKSGNVKFSLNLYAAQVVFFGIILLKYAL